VVNYREATSNCTVHFGEAEFAILASKQRIAFADGLVDFFLAQATLSSANRGSV
jgi:hypothetical protein